MVMYPPTDLGGNVVSKYANGSEISGASGLIVAGATEDGLKVEGVAIDRIQSGGMALSAVVVTTLNADIADTETLKLAHEIQFSDDGSTWDTAVAIEASTTKATGAGAVVHFETADEHDINFAGYTAPKRYFRINVTPTLSASSTDQCHFTTTAILGGLDRI